ncbi:N-acetylmuramoyl-L-alanine amidase-like domain-containing protein [uncultured Maribacter sp.]|uniref:N-acetylmuramoyl-L-alanine amidase-like domain-containing protein n=1 Tax=uncultured Maribacter sp. TaxID=431308 RepID=UPI002632A4EF|nr:N-acetylmuramoyl-L-alanine amidase-like domain-containing protein [uncultured Maribacter sp.]
MKPILQLIITLFTIQTGFSQQLVCSTKDKDAFESKIIEIDGLLESEFGKTITTVGKTFLGTPYVAKTLEVDEKEPLVINFQGLDCTTFVENVLAFSNLLKDSKTEFSDFTKTLEKIRYKDGSRDGYASRLHYFSEWIVNNEEKGLIKNITSDIGGIEIAKTIDFMSTHRELYPFLKDNEKNYNKIKASEKFLNNEVMCVLEQGKIEAHEHLIKSGDIIALTTSIKGLDITHTGIATREKDGRIHLLHASSSGEVKVSKEPLVDYLKKIKNNTGIMVCRPL